MFKFIGAITFGLLAACGVGYFILKQQEDKAIANQIDCWFYNLGNTLKKQGKTVGEKLASVLNNVKLGPVLVEDQPAA